MGLPKRILIADDFSSPACRAGDVALAWAKRLGAELYWTHAAERLPATLPPSAAPLVTSYVERTRHEGQESLEAAVERAREQGIPCESRLVDAPSAAGILDYAEDVGADLVVVGSRGHGGFQNVLLGSVAERVVRDARSRVLVVRGGGDPTDPRCVVLGDDLTDDSMRAREDAVDLARSFSATLDVLHSPELGIPGFRLSRMEIPPFAFDKIRAEACQEIESLMAAVTGPDVTKCVRQDEPAHALCDRAAEVRADLVVVGTRSPSDIERVIFGSVAGRVVRHAPCSVLVSR